MQYFWIKLNLAHMELFYTENARTWVVGRHKVNIELLMVFGCYEAYSMPQTSGDYMAHKLCKSSKTCGLKIHTNHHNASFIHAHRSIYLIVLTFMVCVFTSFHSSFWVTMERIGSLFWMEQRNADTQTWV